MTAKLNENPSFNHKIQYIIFKVKKNALIK